LYSQLHYTGFGRVDLARQGRDAIDWHDEALTKLWSSVNRESAKKYSEAVEQIERGSRKSALHMGRSAKRVTLDRADAPANRPHVRR
jgi:hypothetical protein